MINNALEKDNLPKPEFKHHLGYTTQLLISRKVSGNLSLEQAPTYFHDNYVTIDNQYNSQFAMGFGSLHKLGKRWSLNADYGLHINRASDSPFKNPISTGVDLETGGQVFQMHFTNVQAMRLQWIFGSGNC